MIGSVVRHPGGILVAEADLRAEHGRVPCDHLVNATRPHRHVMQYRSGCGHEPLVVSLDDTRPSRLTVSSFAAEEPAISTGVHRMTGAEENPGTGQVALTAFLLKAHN